MIDVLIPSYAKSETLKEVTDNCLKSLFESSEKVRFNAVVLEQNEEVEYDVTTLHYDFPFNYNKVLNYGISKTKSPYIILSNNDVHFHKGFAEALLRVFDMGYLSISPYCPKAHKEFETGNHIIKGNITGKTLPGWCIAVKRDIFKIIGKLNEDVEFFFSDNAYCEQLNQAGITHALVCNSFVTHLGSKTFDVMDKDFRANMGWGQKVNFNIAKEKIHAKGARV